jgi:hypothetical protein
MAFWYWLNDSAPELSDRTTKPDLGPNSRAGILAKQAPEKVYDLLTKTPEITFKTKTDANPGRQVPLSSIDIPNSDISLRITTIRTDQFPTWKNLKQLPHTSADHCYFAVGTPHPKNGSYHYKDGSYYSGQPYSSDVICYDKGTPYILRGSQKTFKPLSDKVSFIESHEEFITVARKITVK